MKTLNVWWSQPLKCEHLLFVDLTLQHKCRHPTMSARVRMQPKICDHADCPTAHAPEESFEESLCEEIHRLPHLTINIPLGTMKSESVCSLIISTAVHPIDVTLVWGPKEVQCGVGSCLDEQFSRKLQAAIPEAKQLARSEQACFQQVVERILDEWPQLVQASHYLAR